jgi:hypothetical protein
MELQLPATFGEFATWLATAGAFGFIMSLVVEWVPGWENANSNLKFFVTLALALGLGFASYALVTWVPAGIKESAEPYYQLIITAIGIWAASQGTHFLLIQRADRLHPEGTVG